MPTLFQIIQVFKTYPPVNIEHDPTPGTYEIPMDVELSCGCGKPPAEPARLNVLYGDIDRTRGNEHSDKRQRPARAMCPNGCSEKITEVDPAVALTQEAFDDLIDLAIAELDIQPGPGKTLIPLWQLTLLGSIVLAVILYLLLH